MFCVDFDNKDAQKLQIDIDKVSNTIEKISDFRKDQLTSM